MPSLNRPNAPDRLPSSDFGNLFTRSRTLRSSEPLTSISTPSPLSFPPNYIGAQPRRRRTFRTSDFGISNPSSPLASPTIGITQRRPVSVERDSRQAAPNNRIGHYRAASSPSGLPHSLEEEPTPLSNRPSSPFNSGAIQILEISSIAAAPNANKPDESLQEVRSSDRWTRDFLGGRLEIRLRKPDGHSEHVSQDTTPPPLARIATMGVHAAEQVTWMQTSSVPQWSETGSNQPLLGGSHGESDSTISITKEGLYCRTKRALGLKRDARDPTDRVIRSSTPTAHVLDRVSSNLREIAAKRLTSFSAATSVSNLSIAAPRRHRFRPNSIYSTSSSVRERMMGTPPIPTPDPETTYNDQQSRSYFDVEISNPQDPNFLPSEAHRISTPPLPDEPGKSRDRGFFFAYQAPPTQDFAPHGSARSGHTGRTGSVSDTEWYRRKLDIIDAECSSPEEFVTRVPEHLPNSPLCPRHPKHKLGGKGSCPYHGKNKGSPPQTEFATRNEDRIRRPKTGDTHHI